MSIRNTPSALKKQFQNLSKSAAVQLSEPRFFQDAQDLQDAWFIVSILGGVCNFALAQTVETGPALSPA